MQKAAYFQRATLSSSPAPIRVAAAPAVKLFKGGTAARPFAIELSKEALKRFSLAPFIDHGRAARAPHVLLAD
jgi:hypothetical protein